MKMLITGGSGFIGTNAAVYFSKKGWQVTVVDDFSRSGSRTNEAFLRASVPGITIIEMNVADTGRAVSEHIEGGAYDVIIHAAAQVAVTTSVTEPMMDFNTNAFGTLAVLDGARRATKKPIVLFTSTNKVYGGLEHVAVKDEGTRYVFPDMPYGVPEEMLLDFHSPYGCSKGAADQYVRDWHRIYDVPTVVFRQSCIYGSHQFGIVDQGWVAFLTMRALFGKPITIYGTGKQVRDILHVNDLLRAFNAAIENIGKTKGQIYNIGGGPEYTSSILEFVSFLKKKVDTVPVAHSDWRPGDQKLYISDIRKAERDFGWKPEIALEQGFDDMFAWIKENRPILEPLVV